MIDPRTIEAACAAYKGVAGRVSRQAMVRALGAADGAVPQVPAEVADGLVEALGAVLRSPHDAHVRLRAGKALADYRAARQK